ncbi:MAG: YegS/Rv2252/BmrU family lipid kinase [Candidatus Eremiobacteraeota bacterium]|nr:YegS/Rv2252/BmrU family lipid kinase [Candidatus Eremiobacteraeota bacterium]
MLAQLILNEHSRRGRESAPALRAALRDAGIDFVESADPSRIAEDAGCLIGAGGDGTIVGCISGAIERNIPLGIVPLGTFNELARTLEVPLDLEGAVRVIAAAAERAIDVGCVNGKYFVNEASIGISSRISRMQTPQLKQRFGFLAIVVTALQAFRHSRAMHAEVLYDGKAEQFRTIQLTIANSHRFGGFLQVADAAIDDGMLDLYSVDIRNFSEAFFIAQALFAGKTRAVPGLRCIRARSFEIRTRHRHHIAADAEPAGFTPARFELRPKALRVFVRLP